LRIYPNEDEKQHRKNYFSKYPKYENRENLGKTSKASEKTK